MTEVKNYKGTGTYRAIVKVDVFNVTIFNNGTQSHNDTRTTGHKLSCEKEGFNYEILYQELDRLFENKVISKSYDEEYVKRIADVLNRLSGRVCARTYNEWKNSLSIGSLNEIKKGTINGLDRTNLSKTECIVIDNSAMPYLSQAIAEVNKWYYNTKTIRIKAEEFKASRVNSIGRLEAGERDVCLPIKYSFWREIIQKLKDRIKTLNREERRKIKKVSVQGIGLAAHVAQLLPWAKIRVIVVADDELQNKECILYMESDEQFDLVYCNCDAEVEEVYMNDTNDFDIILGNPPYDKSLHAEILQALKESNPNSYIVWLAPENLITAGNYGDNCGGYSNILVKVRTRMDKYAMSYIPKGNQFGDITIGTRFGIYEFSNTAINESGTNLISYYENYSLEPLERSIRNKIANAPKFNVLSIKGFCEKYQKNNKAEHSDSMNQKYDINSSNSVALHTASALYLSPLSVKCISQENYMNQGNAVKFLNEVEVNKFLTNVNIPEYKYILNLYSTNGRDLYWNVTNWPESFEACQFTEEEKAWLKSNYRGK